MNFDSEYRQLAALIESRLSLLNEHQSTLYRASNYSLQAGGKRFRSVLALATAKLAGQQEELFLPFATALEYLHTASLIHDDLPALDNDGLRRGRPSCHRVYGEGAALLAGDSLIARAFLEITQAKQYSADQKTMLVETLASAFNALCEGQVLDLESEAGWEDWRDESASTLSDSSLVVRDLIESGVELSSEERGALLLLEHRHLQKTGALIQAAALGPLEVCGWGVEEHQRYQAVKRYAALLGLLFQLTDDLLDVEGMTSELGKPAGSDERRQLVTFPSALGVQKTRVISSEVHRLALTALSPFGKQAWFLSELASHILERTH